MPTKVDLLFLMVGLYYNSFSSFTFIPESDSLKELETKVQFSTQAVPKSTIFKCPSWVSSKLAGLIMQSLLLDLCEQYHLGADTRWCWLIRQSRIFWPFQAFLSSSIPKNPRLCIIPRGYIALSVFEMRHERRRFLDAAFSSTTPSLQWRYAHCGASLVDICSSL